MKREGPYFPTARNVLLAWRVSRASRSSENKGKIVPRNVGEIWGLFQQRRSVVWYHGGSPVAHAAITHIFPPEGGQVPVAQQDPTAFKEVGAVLSMGAATRRNGFGEKAVRTLVAWHRSPNTTIIAMVDENNVPSMGLFGKKLGGVPMRREHVPSAAFAEKIPGATAEEVVFNVTHINDR